MSFQTKKKLLYVGNALSTHDNTPTTIEKLSSQLRLQGFTVVTTSSKANKALRLIDMYTTFFRVRKRTDLVLIDTYSTLNFWYAVTIARLCEHYQIPYIPLLHGGHLPRRLSESPRLSRRLFGKAYQNIAPSAYLKQEFEKFGLTNVTHIPNAIPIDDYHFIHRSKLRPKLFWLRSFAHLYHPLMALKVLEVVTKTYPNAKLTMVGPSKDDSYKVCLAFAKAKDLSVNFVGYLERKQWVALASQHDLFLNTATIDNQPLSVIEAMALGLPVISTNVGGIPYLIQDQHNGLLVAANDFESMAEKVLFLLKSQEVASQLSAKGRQTAERYDWSTISLQWLELLS